MITVRSTLLILIAAGGIRAIAQTGTDGNEATNLPSIEETTTAKADGPRRDFRNDLFYGGYINLSFGSYRVIGVEPMIGYRVNPRFSAGVKARYNYIEDDRYAVKRTTSTYGGSVFGRYRINPKIYAQAEAASYNYETFYLGGGSERDWVPFLLLGGGVMQPLNEQTWLYVELLFDVLQDEKSPYEDWEPFLSIGVAVGF